MKNGYLSGMLAGGLIGMAAAVWLMPYVKPAISTAVEKGRDFMDNMNSQK